MGAIKGVMGSSAPDLAPVKLETMEDAAVAMRPVKDTLSNRIALSDVRNAEQIAALKGYVNGNHIPVTYYNQINPTIANNAHPADYEQTTNKINRAYLKIIDMLVVIRDDFQFTYTEDTNTSVVTGTFLAYGGLQPRVGDMFLYGTDPGRFGLFKISRQPTRLAARTNSFIQCPFELVKYVDAADIAQLDLAVERTAVFNLKRFLTEPGALLTHVESLLLEWCDQTLRYGADYYRGRFYDDITTRTYMRPDGVYDPYLVNFLSNLFEFEDVAVYGTKLLHTPVFEKRSIWYFLEEFEAPQELMLCNVTTETYSVGARSTKINALIGRQYLQLQEAKSATTVPYIYDRATATADVSERTLTGVIYEFLTHRRIDIEAVQTLYTAALTATPAVQFYHLPVLFCLVKHIRLILQSGRQKITLVHAAASGS
jgi:hypothetical protein